MRCRKRWFSNYRKVLQANVEQALDETLALWRSHQPPVAKASNVTPIHASAF